MLILGLETSCDDTAAAVLQGRNSLLSNVINDQTNIHSKFGGIVPELAGRSHIDQVHRVINQSLQSAHVKLKDIDLIAVTIGPGLIGSLLVGVNAAKGIAYGLGIPLIGVNHLEGHLLAIYLQKQVDFPFISLVVSGGHTDLYRVDHFGKYKILGRTRDDAAGESFDKVAKMLGHKYPGGPKIEKIAKDGNPNAHKFPRAYLDNNSLDFSFSGLKTSVKTFIQAAEKLYKEGFTELVMVAGSDRIQEFQRLLDRYNGKPDKKGNVVFDFPDGVKVVSSGERDPDSADPTEAISASVMRKAAQDGDFDTFKKGSPLKEPDAKKMYLDVRKFMGVREEREMGDDYDSLRDAYLTGKIWNVGESVETEHGTGEVVRKGTNYISYMVEGGKVYKSWLTDIAERNYKKEYANYQGTPEQIARRSSRNKARRAMGDKVVKGMDVGHKDNNPLNNDPKNLRNEDPSKNRREPRLREEDELDEMSWYKTALAKISQMSHPRHYEKMVKRYAADMKKPELKNKTASYIAANIANDYRGQDGRKLVQYINKLVDDGKLPKELKAEYQEEETMQTFSDLVKQINEVKQDKDVKDK